SSLSRCERRERRRRTRNRTKCSARATITATPPAITASGTWTRIGRKSGTWGSFMGLWLGRGSHQGNCGDLLAERQIDPDLDPAGREAAFDRAAELTRGAVDQGGAETAVGRFTAGGRRAGLGGALLPVKPDVMIGPCPADGELPARARPGAIFDRIGGEFVKHEPERDHGAFRQVDRRTIEHGAVFGRLVGAQGRLDQVE